MKKQIGNVNTDEYSKSLAWWCIPVIPALEKQRQEDQKFETSLGYIVRSCLKTKQKNKQTVKKVKKEV
jgi:hypothetical protein